MSGLIIVLIVDSAGLGELKIFVTVTIVVCALTAASTRTTTANPGNTNRIVLCVRSFSSVLEVLHMKCLVGMLFIGNVFANWLLTIHVVPFARRQLRRANG